jgi:hypothetical protein
VEHQEISKCFNGEVGVSCDELQMLQIGWKGVKEVRLEEIEDG